MFNFSRHCETVFQSSCTKSHLILNFFKKWEHLSSNFHMDFSHDCLLHQTSKENLYSIPILNKEPNLPEDLGAYSSTFPFPFEPTLDYGTCSCSFLISYLDNHNLTAKVKGPSGPILKSSKQEVLGSLSPHIWVAHAVTFPWVNGPCEERRDGT